VALKRYTFTIDEDDFADVIAQIEALPEKSAGLRDAVVRYFQGGPPEPAPDPVVDALYAIRDVLASGTFIPAPTPNGHKPVPAPAPTGPSFCEGCGREIDPGATLCVRCTPGDAARNLLGVNFDKL